MNRIRLLAIGSVLTFALTALAQQAANTGGSTKAASDGVHAVVPTAEVQLKFFTAQLDLTGGQQEKMKPILEELHDATIKLVQDDSMPRDEYMNKLRDSRWAADKKIRAILTDDQKKKLDQVEHEPHPELHGNVPDSKN